MKIYGHRERDSNNLPRPSSSRELPTRRKIIIGGTVAVLAAGGVFNVLDLINTLPADTSYTENINLNGVSIQAIVIEHDGATALANKEHVHNIIGKSDVVIPEYYPPEFESLRDGQNWLARGLVSLGGDIALFRDVARTCQEQRKNVWVVDPAYNESFIKLRTFLDMTSVGGGLTIGANILTRIFAAESVSRRGFLASLLKRSLLGGMIIGPSNALTSAIERDFRHVLIAEHIDQLTKSGELPSGTTLSLLYPNAHWTEIKRFLKSPNERAWRLAIYKEVIAPFLPELFQARHYPDGKFNSQRETIQA